MGGLLSRLSGREVLQTNLSRLLSPLFAQTEMRASASIANTAPPVNQASLPGFIILGNHAQVRVPERVKWWLCLRCGSAQVHTAQPSQGLA
jgi:hypothetical protein